MTPLYAYSLIPVLSISLLLCTSSLLYGRSMLGLTLYCLAIAVWSGVLLMFAMPDIAHIAVPFAQVGAFVSASFIHAAYDYTEQRRYTLVALAYAVATVITAVGILWPDLLYAPASLRAGPAFWPALGLGIGAVSLPLWQIARAYPASDTRAKQQLRTLGVSGTLCFLGAWTNVIALSHGLVVPYPMFMVLASLLLLTGLLQHTQHASGQRLLERSLLYAALTAMLSAGFLFGVMLFMQQRTEPWLQQYRLGALFLLIMAALAFEPLRLHLQQWISRWILAGHAGSQELAEALAAQEQRADQVERLAELGTFASAVAHEIRNPLGVIAANIRLLQAEGANPDVCTAVRKQVERASTFIDDLLRYGRPRPLEIRLIDLTATLQLARSTVMHAMSTEATDVNWLGFESFEPILIEADQGQLTQVFTILFENAVHALQGYTTRACRVQLSKEVTAMQISVEDSGPGIPEALRQRLFDPFVTGRKRTGKHSGTGLGLAIAKGIVDRHHGVLTVGTSELGGACFQVRLPPVQKLVSRSGELSV
jgi:signal transduction histidine kinase